MTGKVERGQDSCCGRATFPKSLFAISLIFKRSPRLFSAYKMMATLMTWPLTKQIGPWLYPRDSSLTIPTGTFYTSGSIC